MMDSIGVGICGLGRHGERYARHVAQGEVAGMHLAAVWRRDGEKGRIQAEALGCAFCGDIGSLIVRQDVQAIIAAVPASLNRSIVELAADFGKPCLVEKPVSISVADGMAMLDAVELNNSRLTIAQTLRFDPLTIALRERVGELGPVLGLSFEQRLEPRGLAWEDKLGVAGGGVLIQSAIHTLDALRWTTRADRVEVRQGITQRVLSSQCEDHALLHLGVTGECTDNRTVLAQLAVSKIAQARQMRFALHCEQGLLEADFVERCLRLRRDAATEQQAMPARPTLPLLLRAWRDYLRDEGPNPVPAQEGLAALRLVQDAYQRAAETDID